MLKFHFSTPEGTPAACPYISTFAEHIRIRFYGCNRHSFGNFLDAAVCPSGIKKICMSRFLPEYSPELNLIEERGNE